MPSQGRLRHDEVSAQSGRTIRLAINCECISPPVIQGWQVMTAGAKSLTERELQFHARKAALDQVAKQARHRQSS